MADVCTFRVDLRRSIVQTAWTTVEIPAEWDDRRTLAFLDATHDYGPQEGEA